MIKQQFYQLPDMAPVILKDGKIGLLLLLPGDDDKVGIQVPGEDEHRWIHITQIERRGQSALAQIGAPTIEEVGKRLGYRTHDEQETPWPGAA